MTTKNILITGIHGNVGLACRKLFSDNGWYPYGFAREYKGDASNWEKMEKWALELKEMAGDISFDLVVLAHGVQQASTLAEMTKDVWENVLVNNLGGSLVTTSTLMRHDMISPGGLVVYFSSIQATQPRKGRGAYAAAKAGIEGLMRAAAVELAPIQARAIALRIGQMTKAMKFVNFTPEDMYHFEQKIPLRLVSPESIASLIMSLYDQYSLTGEVIEITSGHKLLIWP